MTANCGGWFPHGSWRRPRPCKPLAGPPRRSSASLSAAGRRTNGQRWGSTKMPRLDHKPVPKIDTLYSLSLGELAEEPKRECPEPNRTIRKKMLTTAFQHYRSEWMGGMRSWKEATAILGHGWPEGAERLRALVGKLSA